MTHKAELSGAFVALGLVRWGTCFWGPTSLTLFPNSVLNQAGNNPRWTDLYREVERELRASHLKAPGRGGLPQPNPSRPKGSLSKWERISLRTGPSDSPGVVDPQTSLSQGKRPALLAWPQLSTAP